MTWVGREKPFFAVAATDFLGIWFLRATVPTAGILGKAQI
jgi:hypothetical protein